MDKVKVGIVGCGAAGTSFFLHFVNDCVQNKIGHVIDIYIFEQSPDIARGLPYNFDYDCNLLNRVTSKMSVKYNQPNDFFIWAKNNEKRIKDFYPKIDLGDENSYLPRVIFGLYLYDSFLQTLCFAEQNKITVNVVRDEVVDINRRGDKVDIQTSNNKFEKIDFIVLTVGHVPSCKFKSFSAFQNYYNSPYPTTQLVSTIDKNSTVGILGSRLSAIDAAIALTEYGHKGKIYFFSRNRFLPSIKATENSNRVNFINEKMIENIKPENTLTFKKIIRLISSLASYYNQEKAYLYRWLKRPSDPIKFLKNELKESSGKVRQIWDVLFLDGNKVIEFFWNKLLRKEKLWFLDNYKSKWLSYRVGIPRKNAEKILKLLESNQLELIQSEGEPKYEAESKKFYFSELKDNSVIKIDYLINATGTPTKVEEMESKLIKNIIKSGLAKSHEFGGISVDFDKSNIIDFKGRALKNIYAIGSITSGVYFFTSVLDLNIKHAFNISSFISENILKRT